MASFKPELTTPPSLSAKRMRRPQQQHGKNPCRASTSGLIPSLKRRVRIAAHALEIIQQNCQQQSVSGSDAFSPVEPLPFQ